VVPPVSADTLAQQQQPAQLTIARVKDKDAKLLRHLKELGLMPGTAIEFIAQEPFGGAYLVRVGDEIVRVAPKAAEQIYVGAREIHPSG
jgi:Fe2+ transport system protein FeoA